MKNDQVTPAETAAILQNAEQCLGVEGDFVELGCYRGDTSVLLGKLLQQNAKNAQNSTSFPHNHAKISTKNTNFSTKSSEISTNSTTFSIKHTEKSTKPIENSTGFPQDGGELSTEAPEDTSDRPKRLWIYDSFAGLPAKTREDNSGAGANFQAGELLVTKREVVEKIRRAGLRNVVIKKAWFNELTEADLPECIAFGFLDGDLYESIKTSLALVAPRLAKQGIMIVHDYNNPELPGSSRAVDEFLRAHQEYKLKVQHTLAILTR